MISIRKLSNLQFSEDKNLVPEKFKQYRNLFLHFSRAIDIISYSCNNNKDYFSWEPEKINVKFHENCENTGKILKISCVRCHLVKFDIYFLGLL